MSSVIKSRWYWYPIGFVYSIGNASAETNKELDSAVIGISATNALSVGYMLKLVSALIIVLLFFYLFSRLMKSVQSGMGQSNNMMSVTSSIQVGSKEKIVMLKVDQRQFLVGITANSINTLAELEETSIVTEVNENSFQKKMKTILGETQT